MPNGPDADEMGLLKLAAGGDEGAFGQLVEGHSAQLRAYCYRMLGSLQDAEDAVQDALLRAWRGLPGFEGRSSFRSWLYSIATNTALDIARRRSRRELPVGFGPSAPAGGEIEEALPEVTWLEPFPDGWLPGEAGSSPEARYDQRESVELAFMIMLQTLPPLQRAILILRDVLGFSAAEAAGLLNTSLAAANSALQRARAAARADLPARSQQSVLRTLGDQRVREIVRQYATALEHGDADALISMLTGDASWSMPPVPTWYQGLPAVRDFLVRYPLRDRWRHQPVSCNGQLAVACYIFDQASDAFCPHGIDVLTLRDDKIAAVTAFLIPDADPAPLFARFQLPATPG
jgi:RNA polymerase sigma-70 factor, ECF subfamily